MTIINNVDEIQSFNLTVMPFATVPQGYTRRAAYHVFIRYEHHQVGRSKLLISAVHGATPNGNAKGGCGQHIVTPSDAKWGDGWKMREWAELRSVWRTYHLNTMQSGTPAQVRAVDAFERMIKKEAKRPSEAVDAYNRPTTNESAESSYDRSLAHLEHMNLHTVDAWVNTERHVLDLDAMPPVTAELLGYTKTSVSYGRGWWYKPVPQGVLAFLRNLPPCHAPGEWKENYTNLPTNEERDAYWAQRERMIAAERQARLDAE